MNSSGRGGEQRIPRPPLARSGRPAPWARLEPEQRRLGLDTIREACLRLPPPRQHLIRVPGIRAAGVLMPFFEREGEAWLVLTKRPDHMPTHKGEIAFPGGKREEGDRSLRDTALRELEEEIGVDREAVEVIGEMKAFGTVSSRFGIVPFVGVLDEPTGYVPDPSEVEAILEVPVSELLDDGVHREERWGIGPADHPVHFFELENETVWGATAGILYGFLTHLVGS